MTKMFNSSSNNLNKATSVKGKLLGTDEKKGGVTVGSGINNNNLSTTNKNNTTTQATTAAAPSTTNSGRKGKRSQQQQPPIDEVKAANKVEICLLLLTLLRVLTPVLEMGPGLFSMA